MKIVVCWYWGDKYPVDYVHRLAAGVKRNLKQAHRFVVVSEGASIKSDAFESWELLDTELLCYGFGTIVRMRLFDSEWQLSHGIGNGDQIVNIDLDTVITGRLDELLNRNDEFVILQNINTTNPNPYNGSLWMVKARRRSDAWADFTLDRWRAIPRHAKLSDQDWLRYKFPKAAAWGPEDGVYGFKKKGWISQRRLMHNAKIVTFPGRDPSWYTEVDWIKYHWLGER